MNNILQLDFKMLCFPDTRFDVCDGTYDPAAKPYQEHQLDCGHVISSMERMKHDEAVNWKYNLIVTMPKIHIMNEQTNSSLPGST